MSENALAQFAYACREYLSTLSIGSLRAYGRNIGVAKSTEKKKGELVEEIVLVLSGKISPIEQSKRGAPIRNDYVDPKIPETIEKLRWTHLGGAASASSETVQDINPNIPEFNYRKELQNFRTNNEIKFVVKSPEQEAKEEREHYAQKVYEGQVETLEGVPCLLALNCIDNGEKVILPIELIREYDLREGDIVSCYIQKSNIVFVATEILTINGKSAEELRRGRFDECDACYPTKRIRFFEEKNHASLTSKYLQWLLPIGRGQRGCILSEPKAGKTELLYTIAEAAAELNPDLTVLVLLVGQAPEEIGRFRKIISKDELVYTTYEDEPERQIFTAEFLLKRAKRLAESGRDVLLLVDSLNTLARAYNDTTESMGGRTLVGGLESKTLQYLKKFFGVARCLEKSGSVTVLGALSTQTGNPADELIASELCALANLEIRLSEALAIKRIYPAIDLRRSRVQRGGALINEREEYFEGLVRSQYLEQHGDETLCRLLAETNTYEELLTRIKHAVK